METMNNQDLLARINVLFSSDIITSEEQFDTLIIEVAPSKVHETILGLKIDSELSFNFLTLLGAVHYPDNKDREIAMVYHLHSWKTNCRLRIKTYLGIEKPEIATITDIFDGANWLERETYDFFGVNFIGHPNMTRILNEDSMDYFPLRKEFALEDGTREDKDDRYFGRI
jgi:NADH-quinone oxidoreductase subunit C